MLHGHKIIAFFIILFIASVKDMHDRIITDWMPFLSMLISMMPAGLPHPAGILACLPLLIAGVTVGGIGGGDIKIIAAIGTILGLTRTFIGLVVALILMLLFYLGSYVVREIWYSFHISGNRFRVHRSSKCNTW